MAQYIIKINQKTHQIDVASDTPVLWVLRDHIKLLGTKFGCGIGQCGACTIHLDGIATRSCLIPISAIGDRSVTTIEGLSDELNHPIQKAWIEHDVPQCGYCQAGQMMNAASLLNQNAKPSDEDIDTAMNGNICRCGTYVRIKKAIKTASNG